MRQLRNKVRSKTETQNQTNNKVQIKKTKNEIMDTPTQTKEQQINHEPYKCCRNHNYTQAQNPLLINEEPVKTHLPTEQRLRNFTRELHKCAVTTYMDKNAGAGILMCKKRHYNITKATFYDDTDHYKHTHKNKSEIMEDFRKFH